MFLAFVVSPASPKADIEDSSDRNADAVVLNASESALFDESGDCQRSNEHHEEDEDEVEDLQKFFHGREY